MNVLHLYWSTSSDSRHIQEFAKMRSEDSEVWGDEGGGEAPEAGYILNT